MLMTFTELFPSGSPECATFNSPRRATGTVSSPAVHCGTTMELVTPAVGPAAVDYTFGPEETTVQLPPVWRCGCGFQLDAWIQSPYAHGPQGGAAEQGARHFMALSA